jgi:hypothetical protein
MTKYIPVCATLSAYGNNIILGTEGGLKKDKYATTSVKAKDIGYFFM